MARRYADGGLEPWSKFFWKDWRADPRLRICTYSARGLWIDLLSLMHEGEPYGYLTVNGRAPSPRELSGILGGKSSEIGRLLDELKRENVASVTPDGVIFSRRMVRDAARRATYQSNGSKGGQTTHKSKHLVEQNGEQLLEQKSGDLLKPLLDHSLKPRARVSEPEPESDSTTNQSSVAEGAGLGKWVLDYFQSPNLVHAGPVRDWVRAGAAPALIRGVVAQVTAQQRSKNPDWAPRSLNYFTEAVMRAMREGQQPPDPDARPDAERDHWLGRMGSYSRGMWLPEWGDAPGERGCDMPPRLQAEAIAMKKSNQGEG